MTTCTFFCITQLSVRRYRGTQAMSSAASCRLGDQRLAPAGVQLGGDGVDQRVEPRIRMAAAVEGASPLASRVCSRPFRRCHASSVVP